MSLGTLNSNEPLDESILLLEEYALGQVHNGTFLDGFAKTNVYYSTPFGDHKDGGHRLFLLPGPDKTGYLPVFTSPERLKEFFEKAGRVSYSFTCSSYISVIETTHKINSGATPVKMGLIIDPDYYNVRADANLLGVMLDYYRNH